MQDIAQPLVVQLRFNASNPGALLSDVKFPWRARPASVLATVSLAHYWRLLGF